MAPWPFEIELNLEPALFGAESDERAEGRNLFWRLTGLVASISRGFVRGGAKRLLWWLMLTVIAASLTAKYLSWAPEATAAVETAAVTAEAAAGEAAEQHRRTNTSHPPQPFIPHIQLQPTQPSSQSQNGQDDQDNQDDQEGQHGQGGQDGVDIFFQGEFGYELIAVLPFAYWHHLNGSLRSTTTCGGDSLASLYYFSPNHTDDATCHRDSMKDKVDRYGFIGGIHYGQIPPTWQPPPLAEHFRKFPPVWPEIPKGSWLVVIGNKYEQEWHHAPVNYLDLPTLLRIVNSFLMAGFYVVYNNPGVSLETDPGQVIQDGKDLGDYVALQTQFGKNPRLQTMQNLQKGWAGLSFNDVQFRMLARSVCFVSVQGGGSIVESFFGGSNIIYFREGQELKAGAYQRIYPRLSRAKVMVVTSYKGLVRKVHWMIKNKNCYAQLQ